MIPRPTPSSLPAWVTWWQRLFPDADTLLLPGRQPALVDSGFVGNAQETAGWARAGARWRRGRTPNIVWMTFIEARSLFQPG